MSGVAVVESHYVAFYCRTRGRGRYLEERAVCGAWIAPSEHTVEPTCDACQRWLEQDAKDAAAFDASFER